jgi:hypothetical protein
MYEYQFFLPGSTEHKLCLYDIINNYFFSETLKHDCVYTILVACLVREKHKEYGYMNTSQLAAWYYKSEIEIVNWNGPTTMCSPGLHDIL